MAVDPEFRITRARWLRAVRRDPRNLRIRRFEMTSDRYFATEAAGAFRGGGVDLVFVDGLHTWEQSLRDVTNALGYLSDSGLVVLHDCSPRSPAAAFAAESLEAARDARPDGWDGMWSGDVWKTVLSLRSSRSDLDVRVIDDDSGIGLVRRAGAPTVEPALAFSHEEIAALTYADLDRQRGEWLNVWRPSSSEPRGIAEEYVRGSF